MAVAGNDGTVTIRQNPDFEEVINSLCDCDEWIEVMAYSPDGSMLAVGSHNNIIYVYLVAENYFLKGKYIGHSSYITALDWSCDNKWLRSNCGAYELLFWKTDDCSQDPSGRTNTIDVIWATETVKFGWCVEGIYPKGADGTHINSVGGNHDGTLLACGDDYGLVTIFRNPARMGVVPRSYRGHSEHVTKVCFNSDGEYLFSVGGYDQTIMQWKRK